MVPTLTELTRSAKILADTASVLLDGQKIEVTVQYHENLDMVEERLKAALLAIKEIKEGRFSH